MRKTFAIIITVLVAMVLIAGCAGNKAAGSQTPAKTSPTGAPTTPSSPARQTPTAGPAAPSSPPSK